MNLNKYFDKIFVINLKRRPDRLEKFKKIAETISLEFEVFESFDGKEINRDTLIDGNPIIINSNGLYRGFDGYFIGCLGCLLSHLNLLRHCKQNDIKSVLILEDDVDFSDEFVARFDRFSSEFKEDWNMIYFSGSNVELSDNLDSYARLLGCYTTHSYATNIDSYDYLIQQLEINMFSKPVDVVYHQLHSSIKAWITMPFLTYQSDGFSDIQNNFVSYNSIKKYL